MAPALFDYNFLDATGRVSRLIATIRETIPPTTRRPIIIVFYPKTALPFSAFTREIPDLDVAIPVQHSDVVLIHEGYHPVIKAPGTNADYLNFLAGEFERFQRSTILLTIG